MCRTEHVFVCVILLMAVVVSCNQPTKISRAIDNPSEAEPKPKPVRTDTQPGPQQLSPAAQQPVPPGSVQPFKILTKDPEYKALIKPSEGDEFLRLYSADYNAKMAEVEASTAKISDQKLREKARLDAWKGVDKAKFREQALETRTTKLREYMAKHRDGWIELGHGDYDAPAKMFRVYSIPASPFQGTNKFDMPIDIATIDDVYKKFRTLAEPRILARIDQDVVEYFANEDSPGYSREHVTAFLRQQRYTTYESRIRQEQMVVIGRGDLADKNIERIAIVDYSTEAVLLDLDSKNFTASKPTWLY